MREEITKFFPPEFVNRLDYIGLFNPLTLDIIQCILEEKLLPLLEDKWSKKGITLEIHPAAVKFLAEAGFDIKWGARNLERILEEVISSPLAKFLAKKKAKGKMRVVIDVKKDSIDFKIKESFF